MKALASAVWMALMISVPPFQPAAHTYNHSILFIRHIAIYITDMLIKADKHIRTYVIAHTFIRIDIGEFHDEYAVLIVSTKKGLLAASPLAINTHIQI